MLYRKAMNENRAIALQATGLGQVREDFTGKAEDIVTAARSEFARLGYRGVTMRGIAEAANVSTRTVYNNFEDKLALFTACIDAGASRFPVLALTGEPGEALRRLGSDLLMHLSAPLSYQISLMIFRDGSEFPEIRQAARRNYDTFLIAPLAQYLHGCGVAEADAPTYARLFSNMATSEWHRRILFNEPPLTAPEAEAHATTVTRVFLQGVPLAGAD